MAVARKPKLKKETTKNKNAKVQAIINKGGIPAKTNKEDNSIVVFNLRLINNLVARIDTLKNKRSIKPSRHSWILEAIYEKLEREEEQQ